ncbi:hypothetical protein [Okeania sp. SIO2B3]|nr:hypothetical protein [Okeania sp. SIO2B3]
MVTKLQQNISSSSKARKNFARAERKMSLDFQTNFVIHFEVQNIG